MCKLCQCAEDTISLPFLMAPTGSVVCAALSTHAGRNQRSLPDKRARRKPGWLDNTVDPKQAAQQALQQAAADVSLKSTSPVSLSLLSTFALQALLLLLLLLCSAAAAVFCCCCYSAAALLLFYC